MARRKRVRYNPKIPGRGDPAVERMLAETPLMGSFEVLYDDDDLPCNAYEEGIPVLYKYRALGDHDIRTDGTTATEDVVSILSSSQLYAATPAELNDPFEVRVRPGVATAAQYRSFLLRLAGSIRDRDLARQLVASGPADDDDSSEWALVQKAVLGLLEDEWRHVRIVSLSANPADPVLWAHYGGSNNGVVLGFHVRADDLFREALQVVYHETPPRFTVEDYESGRMREGAVLGKAQRWSYENEWRLIVFNPKDPPATTKFLRYRPSSLGEIIFGLRVDEGTERTVRAAAAHLPRVRFGHIEAVLENDQLAVVWEDDHPDQPGC